jgi:hypothetical protein
MPAIDLSDDEHAVVAPQNGKFGSTFIDVKPCAGQAGDARSPEQIRFSMEFKTRSKEAVLADLTIRLEQLSATHPDRAALVRMIAGLRAELALRRPSPANDDDLDKR